VLIVAACTVLSQFLIERDRRIKTGQP
jgi:hypothetical protein